MFEYVSLSAHRCAVRNCYVGVSLPACRLANSPQHNNTKVGSNSLQHTTIEAGFPVGSLPLLLYVLSRGSLSIYGCGSDGVVCAELWPQFCGCAHQERENLFPLSSAGGY